MIVILTENNIDCKVFPGDVFNLDIRRTDGTEEIIIAEEIQKEMVIDIGITFVFTAEDGTVISSSLCGMFGQRDDFPSEIRDAKRIRDLDYDQQLNLVESCPLYIRVED